MEIKRAFVIFSGVLFCILFVRDLRLHAVDQSLGRTKYITEKRPARPRYVSMSMIRLLCCCAVMFHHYTQLKSSEMQYGASAALWVLFSP